MKIHKEAQKRQEAQTRARSADVHRKTKETDVRVRLNLDGTGSSRITIGLPFLEHMLELFAKHGLFDLEVICKGDLEVDDHHSVEDVAITLGQALVQALGDKKGINRYGEAVVPMDEALCRSVIDLSGRFYLVYEVPTKRQKIGNFSVELAEHFWRSFSETAKFNLHIDCLRGRNTHHILEGTFKASARALRQAVELNSRVSGVPSTKGSL
ncbi:MAG TPA: imidazoleglycerol-phosphate dehydratase HisB [Pyrinomonadaceae bacterium]|nr:imidazoleglycerol-phosphate dehydratase HisB [Pyrinomonadaceae bacterium]